jgi:uncharacterized iron-regulated membrane protein
MDPATGEILSPRQTAGGNFLYRFHFELYGLDRNVARWIVGIATMFMFVAMISGIVIHRNIFKDFFTFRLNKGKRSWLDGHNAVSVFALPFHLMITFSGLLLLGFQLFPGASTIAYDGGGMRALMTEMKGLHDERPLPRSGQAAPLTALGPLLAAATRQWPDEGVGAVSVINPGDSTARIELRQSRGSSLPNRANPAHMVFDGVSGKLLEPAEAPPSPSFVRGVWSALNALHLGRFAAPLVRCLLFASGILGCLMVASGLVMWLIARERDRESSGRVPFGHGLVAVFNVAGVAGLLLAIAGYFWANRLLPAALPLRPTAEIMSFFIIWLLSLVHALLRPHRQAWVEQLWACALLYALLPVLNAATGGVALWTTLAGRGNWAVSSFDLCALLLGLALMHAARKLRHYTPPVRASKRGAQSVQDEEEERS